MSICATCEDTGMVPFALADNPKPDAEIAAADLHFALCLCDYGLSLRRTTNNGRTVPPLWQVWAAQHQVSHDRIHRAEDVFTAEELAAAGFSKPTLQMPNREAVMLAAGKKRK